MNLLIRYRNGRWNSDRISDDKIFQQIRNKSGNQHNEWPDNKNKVYDSILRAASELGVVLEVVDFT